MVVATPLENIRQKENLLSNFSCRKKFQKYPLKTNRLNYFLKQDHQNIIFLIKQYLPLPKNIISYNQHPLFFASLVGCLWRTTNSLAPPNGFRSRRRPRASEAFTLAVSTVCRALALPAARWALAPCGQATRFWESCEPMMSWNLYQLN